MIKRFIKFAALGGIGAFILTFVFYYLLSSNIRGHLWASFYYTIQGVLGGICYFLLTITAEKHIEKPIFKNPIITNTIIGLVSGAFSSILSIYLSWKGFSDYNFSQPDVYVPRELINKQILDLTYYFIGSTFTGLLFGVTFGKWKKATQQ